MIGNREAGQEIAVLVDELPETRDRLNRIIVRRDQLACRECRGFANALR